MLEEVIPSEKYTIQLEAMDSQALPLVLTQPEFMRRMKEMQQGGMTGSQFDYGLATGGSSMESSNSSCMGLEMKA